MKKFTYLFFCVFALFAGENVFAVQSLVSVKSQGKTISGITTENMQIQIKIETQEIQIEKTTSDENLSDTHYNCTYSRYPCSIVKRIEIIVNGDSLFVPHSIFCDLSDLTTADLFVADKKAILTLRGGDASESYIVKIEFDELQVKRKTLYSAMSADQPLQINTYHVRTIGD